MVIARAVPGGSPEVLAREKMPVRLGSGGDDMDLLQPDAIERAVNALIECRHIAEAHNAEVAAIATSAVREARHQTEFLNRAYDEAGITVEVVSGIEEARLIPLGAMSAVPISGRPHLVIDIGGGSTELVVAKDAHPEFARSIKLGHIRLTDRFFAGGIIGSGSVTACRRHIRSWVAPVASEVRRLGFEVAVGCSGTIEAVAFLCSVRRGEQPLNITNATITRTELATLEADLIMRVRPEDRLGVAGLDARRSDVIIAGVVLLHELFKLLEVNTMVISTGALREGVLVDRFNLRGRTNDDGLHHLNDLRRSSALALARSYREDLLHAEHATDLALELFDETQPLHGFGTEESELLEAAGLLHNIGRFVADSKHHKHSYYLIRHSERLAGFTDGELKLIALVARYHRKSAPQPRHPAFASLSESDEHRGKVLAGLLRIGIALDRTYKRAVKQVHANLEGATVLIDVEITEGTDAGIEGFTAQRNRGLLEDALGRNVNFSVVVIDELRKRSWHPSRRGSELSDECSELAVTGTA